MEASPQLKINDEVTWNFSRPYVMGIINITPDSFYDGGWIRNLGKNGIINVVKKYLVGGVDLIDIGGESSRPGALPISAEEEIKRVLPDLKRIRKKFPELIISLDTYKKEVAQMGIENGVDIINDITAGEGSNNEIFQLCAKNKIPIIIMHKKGVPETMQKEVKYENVVQEVYDYLKKKIASLEELGLEKNKIIIDVGIGFGKYKKENLELLKKLSNFKKLGTGILVGASRKTIVGDIIGKEASERLFGSIGIHLAAIENGADIIRVHDPVEMRDALQTYFEVVR